jgi:hypothetical protein
MDAVGRGGGTAPAVYEIPYFLSFS